MAFPAETTSGEIVQIVQKKILDAARATGSTIFLSDDGREFVKSKASGLLEEITAIVEEGVEIITETVDSVEELVEGAAEQVGDLVDEANEKVEDAIEDVKDALGFGDEEEPAA